jgi:rubredoxin
MNYTYTVCGFKYEEKFEKVPFDQLPEDWHCPICNAEQAQFIKDE